MASSITANTKIALITGANQGIGFATARHLASLSKDYHILLGSRDPSKGTAAALNLQKEDLSVESITIDVTSDASIEAAASTISSKYGRLDILINNAGIAPEGLDPSASLRDDYLSTFNVNVFGVAAVTETFIPLLEKSPYTPHIVFVSSRLGSLAWLTNAQNIHASVKVPMYRASKSALNMLMVYYALKYKEKGWKINASCPKFTKTNLNGFKGTGTPEEGAENIVRLATVGDEGETGTFSDRDGEIVW